MTDELIDGGEEFAAFQAALMLRMGDDVFSSWMADLRLETLEHGALLDLGAGGTTQREVSGRVPSGRAGLRRVPTVVGVVAAHGLWGGRRRGVRRCARRGDALRRRRLARPARRQPRLRPRVTRPEHAVQFAALLTRVLTSCERGGADSPT